MKTHTMSDEDDGFQSSRVVSDVHHEIASKIRTSGRPSSRHHRRSRTVVGWRPTVGRTVGHDVTTVGRVADGAVGQTDVAAVGWVADGAVGQTDVAAVGRTASPQVRKRTDCPIERRP